jgi:type IV pilus assembly protein PilQ
LRLLDKHSSIYGETLDTMLAKARIYDKIGNSSKASDQYRAILSSGFQIRPDLKQYIEGRLPSNKF